MPLDPISTEDLSRLTTLMFAAALDDQRWPDFMQELSVVSGDINTHMFGVDSAGPITLDIVESGYDPEYVRSYAEYFGSINPWVTGFMAKPVGESVRSQRMCTLEELVKTEFYNDWVLPQEDIAAGGGAVLFKDESRVFVLGGNIRSKDEERLQDRWLTLVELIVPHLQQALEVARALAGRSLAAAALAQAGAEPQSAVLIINERRRIIYSNQAADTMLAKGDTVRVAPGRRVAFCNARAAAALSYAMSHSDERGSMLSSSFQTGTRGGKRYTCRVARIDPSGQDMSPLGTFLSLSGRCTLLTLSAARSAEEDKAARLIGLHGLTQSEASVAERLAAGLTLDEIADERAVSIHTVRNQVKSAMSRLGVRRQSDLVRTVMEARAAPPH
jgi:DNA-binding CsgD family transcriptional regulator